VVCALNRAALSAFGDMAVGPVTAGGGYASRPASIATWLSTARDGGMRVGAAALTLGPDVVTAVISWMHHSARPTESAPPNGPSREHSQGNPVHGDDPRDVSAIYREAIGTDSAGLAAGVLLGLTASPPDTNLVGLRFCPAI
jgi:hypothetical protein